MGTNIVSDDASQDEVYCARKALVERLAGEHFPMLWTSQESVFEFLRHSNPDVQAAALVCGTTRWRLGGIDRFRADCCEIAAKSSDQLQFIAIAEMGQIFFASQDRIAKGVLQDIIHNEVNSIPTRNHAYRTLRGVEYGFEYSTIEDGINEARRQLSGCEVLELADMDPNLIRQERERIERKGGAGLID